MIPYTLHAALLVICCYLFYRLFLARESFYRLNRWLLLGFVLLVFLGPLLRLHPDWTIPLAFDGYAEEGGEEASLQGLPSVILMDRLKGATHAELETGTTVEDRGQPAIAALAGEPASVYIANEASPPIGKEDWPHSLIKWLTFFYLAGVFFFALHWLLQVASLISKIIHHPIVRKGRYRIVQMTGDTAPCSFLHFIFINPARHEPEVLEHILEHEQIHARQLHSLDMVLAELLTIVQWFNPAAWFLRRAVIDNLEFLTDRTVLSGGADRQSYQMNLLKVAAPHYAPFLVSNYNYQALRKRIARMNRRASSLFASWKYIAVAFMILGSILALDSVRKALWPVDWEVEAREEEGIDEQWAECFWAMHDITFVQFSVEQMTYLLAQDAEEEMYRIVRVLSSYGFRQFSTDQIVHMSVQELASELEIVIPALNQAGFRNFPADQIMEICRQEAGSEFAWIVQVLNRTGFRHFSSEQIMAMSVQEVGEELETILTALNQTGFRNFGTDEIMHLCMQEVGEELADIVRALNRTGFHNFSPEQIMTLSIHEESEELERIVMALNRTGFRNFTPEQIVQLCIQEKSHELEEMLKILQASGFRDLDPGQIMVFIDQQAVDEELAKVLRILGEMGVDRLTLDQVLRMKEIMSE
jgi:hypothetical protein